MLPRNKRLQRPCHGSKGDNHGGLCRVADEATEVEVRDKGLALQRGAREGRGVVGARSHSMMASRS